MHKHLPLAFSLILLSACAPTSSPEDPTGLWINQSAIDAAAKGGPLLPALETHGPNQAWSIDTRSGTAHFRSAIEQGDGQLRPTAPATWRVEYASGQSDELRWKGGQLIQMPTSHVVAQTFSRAAHSTPADAPPGSTFRQMLNAAYMGGQWKIAKGQGKGRTVVFGADGRVTGLGQNDRYALCLGGDCANSGAGNDTLELSKNGVGAEWIFVRAGNRLEISRAINQSLPDEIPVFTQGPSEWVLEKQSGS